MTVFCICGAKIVGALLLCGSPYCHDCRDDYDRRDLYLHSLAAWQRARYFEAESRSAA